MSMTDKSEKKIKEFEDKMYCDCGGEMVENGIIYECCKCGYWKYSSS